MEMLDKTPISKGLGLIVSSGLSSALLFAASASGQSTDSGSQKVDRIEVTGSSIKRIEGGRFLCNKLWNSVRFALPLDGRWVPSSLTLSVNTLLADPGWPTMLLAGTADGVWRSGDGGALWHRDAASPGDNVYALAASSGSP